jgi:autotransporter-associated beta strand protein
MMRAAPVLRLLFLSTSLLVFPAPAALAARSVGIDVSDYQGNLTQANWNSIRADGKDFAWTKATEGGGFTASTFVNNMNRGTTAGVYMGAYHYARPDLNSATTDAAHFVAIAGPYLGNGYLRPMLDIEAQSFTLSTSALSTWINDFCTYVTNQYPNADPLIYIGASAAGSEVNSSVTSHGLDVAQWGSNSIDPPVPTGNPSTGVWNGNWAFWQYGSKGRVNGIGGGTANVDLDVANGDINFVRQYLIGPPPATSFQQFDVNGTTAGSGVTANGNYTWEGAKFSSSAAGNDPVAWNDGNFLRLAAGSDAAASNYTITANSNHTFAGMMLQANGGGTVTINGPGLLSIASGDQGIFVNSSSQNLKINAAIAGNGKLVWQGSGSGTGNQSGGSLFLLGNNTYTGGTALNAGSGVNFDNDHSFGTGRITLGYTGGTATQYVLANDVATAPVTLANAVTTKAGAQLIYVGPGAAPLTFTGAWTLPSGSSRLTIGNPSHTSTKMTINGAIGGSGGALVKDGVGTLVLGGGNTYTGGTTLNGGMLTVSGAAAKLGTGNITIQNTSSTVTILSIESGVLDAINNNATLTLAGGGTAGVADQSYALLGAGVNELVHALVLGGVTKANGTYGSSLSSAMYKLNDYFSGAGIVTVGFSGIGGDFNNDFTVDARDYVLWRKNVGKPAGTLMNDNSGLTIGDAQYQLWRADLGDTAAGSGAGESLANTSVPEPGAIMLMLVGGAAVCVVGDRRRRAG